MAEVEWREDSVRIPSEGSGSGGRTQVSAAGGGWMEDTHTHKLTCTRTRMHMHICTCMHAYIHTPMHLHARIHTLSPFLPATPRLPSPRPCLAHPQGSTRPQSLLHAQALAPPLRSHLLPPSCLPSWDPTGTHHIYIYRLDCLSCQAPKSKRSERSWKGAPAGEMGGAGAAPVPSTAPLFGQ